MGTALGQLAQWEQRELSFMEMPQVMDSKEMDESKPSQGEAWKESGPGGLNSASATTSPVMDHSSLEGNQR